MDPVSGPDAGPVDCGQIMQGGLTRTKKFEKVYDFCLRGKHTCCGSIRKALFGSGNLSKEIRIQAVRHVADVSTAGGRDLPRQWYR